MFFFSNISTTSTVRRIGLRTLLAFALVLFACPVWAADHTNSETVVTTGAGQAYYVSGGDTLTNTSSGTYKATWDGSVSGVYSNTGHIINYGEIIGINTGGNSAYGINCIDGSVINNGDVSAQGQDTFVYGVMVNNSPLTNNGNITATNVAGWAYGVYVDGGSDVENRGTITASGPGAHGVHLLSGGTLHNYGTISATGTNVAAIYADDADIRLYTGSQITGQVHSGNIGSNLYLDGSGTQDFDITGDWRWLTKTGSGTWTLANAMAADTFTSIELQGGTLALGADLHLRDGVVHVRNGATLDLGTYRMTDTGTDSRFYAGSTLKATLKSDGTCGYVARISNIYGATTLVLTQSGAVATHLYTLSDNLSPGSFANLKFSNGQETMETLFGTYQMVNTGDKLLVNSAPVSDATLEAKGINPDDAHAIQKAFENDQDSMDKLNNMSTDEAREALQQAHAESMQGAFTAVLNSEIAARGVIANRLLAARSAALAARRGETGLSSGSDELAWKFWAQGFGSIADESAHGGGNGYNAKTAGLTFGMDKTLRDDFRLGLAYTYIHNIVDSKTSDNANDVDSNMLTLYGEKLYGDDMYLDGHISLGLNKYDTKRYMTAMGLQAEADFDGYTFNIGGEFGKSYALTDTFVQAPVLLTPYIGVDYTRVSIDSYEERGAGASNLIVDGTDNNIFTTTLGTRFAATWDDLTPEAHIAWVHDWAGEKITSNARFASGGAALSSDAVSTDADKLNLGMGLNWQYNDVTTFDFTADYLGSAHMDSFGGTAQVSYAF